VTAEPAAAELARACGAEVVRDTAQDGQSAAVELGIRRALDGGFHRVLCVPGDCPAVNAAELDALLAALGVRSGVVVIPDRHGTGTNGLLLSPPAAIAPGFGPDSCERHVSRARAAGLGCEVVRLASLSLDIDTGSDLDVLRERLAREHVAAAGTRALLAGAGRGAGGVSMTNAA
jgi:2-phospho-L-lactate guanylyltransferase